MVEKIKPRLHEILDKAEEGDWASELVDLLLLVLILLNVVFVLLETVPEMNDQFGTFFVNFDTFSVLIFTVEYLLRLWVCTQNDKYKDGIRGRLKYVLTPMAVVDLLAILPFYLPLLIVTDLRLLRLFRIFRLLRLFKVLRYSESLRVFTDVYRMKKGELTMVFLTILFLLIIASALIFHVEQEAQPDAFSSIPASMWWGVATLTTVGYGDMYPITPLGKFLGSIIAFLGIGLFALPAGIIGSGFVMALRRKTSSKFYCPHCNKEITRTL